MGKSATAAVPPALVHATTKAALLFAAKPAAMAGVLSARVAALANGVLKSMLFTKTKIVSIAFLALAFLGAGILARQVLTAPSQGKTGVPQS
jgi:hypothetical protein